MAHAWIVFNRLVLVHFLICVGLMGMALCSGCQLGIFQARFFDPIKALVRTHFGMFRVLFRFLCILKTGGSPGLKTSREDDGSVNRSETVPGDKELNQFCATWAYKHVARAQCCKGVLWFHGSAANFQLFFWWWAAEAIKHAWNIDLYTSDHPVVHSQLQPLGPQTLLYFENELQALHTSHGRTTRYDCHRRQVWTCASKRTGVPKINWAAHKLSLVSLKT